MRAKAEGRKHLLLYMKARFGVGGSGLKPGLRAILVKFWSVTGGHESQALGAEHIGAMHPLAHRRARSEQWSGRGSRGTSPTRSLYSVVCMRAAALALMATGVEN